MEKFLPTLLLLFVVLTCGCRDLNLAEKEKEEDGFQEPYKVIPDPIIAPVSPEESLKSFRLPKGYHLELVASEPMISEPTAIAWDANGRMYVSQMETYMQTVDAKDQYTPGSRIMLLEDTNRDGRMDKSSIFIDKLVAPRTVLCVGRELLVNETNSFDIHAYKDTNNDGVADQKRIVYSTKEKAYGNIEHQRSGLDWNLDNWIYVTTDPIRFRWKNGVLAADSLPYGNNGQWGITHDNYGRLFYSRAAAGLAATGFHINPVYGQLDFTDRYKDSVFNTIWPIIKTPDVNGGANGLRPDSSLKSFTSVCGQSVFRGDRLPENIVGDYFACEPVGRIIRRAKMQRNDGTLELVNRYKGNEFIASADMNFRPVNTYTGPDGCLYIVDMYRGIIQESTWAQPGSSLYAQIKSKQLDNNIRNGRIYRLIYDDMPRGPLPKMLDEPTDSLLQYLGHPNGWWRDNAQKEIIVRNDRSVIPLLKEMAMGTAQRASGEPSPLARLHALWTLEGLQSIERELLTSLLNDKDNSMRTAAIRISESFLKRSDQVITNSLIKMAEEKNTELLAQLVLSLNLWDAQPAKVAVNTVFNVNKDNELLRGIQEMFVKNKEARKFGPKLTPLNEQARNMVIRGASIFKTLCSSCHGPEGQGLATLPAPPLIGKFKLIENKEAVIRIMLNGLTGPVDGVSYKEPMPSMKENDDEWIASVLNYVRYDLCMRSFPNMPQSYINWVIIKPDEVRRVRDKYKNRQVPWTWHELEKERKGK